MKLVIIYGPPAVGKLTVAKELAKLTKFKIFHNHLTVDLLNSLFKFGSDSFFKFSDKIRTEMLEEAAKQGINGVILTFCYGYPDDNAWIKKLISKIEKQKSKIYFVHLYADKKELHKRVKHLSRGDYDKVKTTKGLNESLKRWDFFTPMPFVKSLSIDNTTLKPIKVAQTIKKYYKL